MRAKPIPMEEQYKLVLECRQSGLSDYHWCLVNITVRRGSSVNIRFLY